MTSAYYHAVVGQMDVSRERLFHLGVQSYAVAHMDDIGLLGGYLFDYGKRLGKTHVREVSVLAQSVDNQQGHAMQALNLLRSDVFAVGDISQRKPKIGNL